jgi:hypothetical protein
MDNSIIQMKRVEMKVERRERKRGTDTRSGQMSVSQYHCVT